MFAVGSALVYYVPPAGNPVKALDPKPTYSASPSLPTESPSPKPKPTKAKPSAKQKPKPKTTPTQPTPSSSPSTDVPVQRPSPADSSPVPVRPTPTPTPKPAPKPTPTYDGTLRVQVINLINQERANRGLSWLASNSGLSDQCQSWAQYMANRDTLVHSNMEYGGEIIASGPSTASHVVSLWLNSPAHRDIMLSSRYSYIGSGQVDGYWVVQFS